MTSLWWAHTTIRKGGTSSCSTSTKSLNFHLAPTFSSLLPSCNTPILPSSHTKSAWGSPSMPLGGYLDGLTVACTSWKKWGQKLGPEWLWRLQHVSKFYLISIQNWKSLKVIVPWFMVTSRFLLVRTLCSISSTYPYQLRSCPMHFKLQSEFPGLCIKVQLLLSVLLWVFSVSASST